MARRTYVRDRRGRFATTGATARGGRLTRESGSRYATEKKAIAGGKPAGTISKNPKAKPAAVSPKQQRQLEGERIALKRSAATKSAQMGYTNVTPGGQSKLYKSAAADRVRIAQIDKQLAGAKPLPTVLAKGRGLTGERMGRYRGNGRFSLYGKDRGVIGRERLASTVRKPAGLKPGSIKPKPAAKPAPKKVDLSQAAFERRAASAEKRARAAEQRVAGADRGYSSATTRRQFQTADALRAAADSYRSIARRGKSGDFSAAQVFGERARYSTAPTLSRSEKAAATRRANAAKRTQEQIRKMEQARRWGR